MSNKNRLVKYKRDNSTYVMMHRILSIQDVGYYDASTLNSTCFYLLILAKQIKKNVNKD